MENTEDQDLKLQKTSPEFIAELKDSLPRFLWKSKPSTGRDDTDSKDTGNVRRLVRQSKTDQLIKLLEPFQEWPQLLDPHLSGLLQPLVSAFVDYLSKHANKYRQSRREQPSPDIIPLPRAICKILYIFCKVRGQKVISRFLNNEPRYMEPMLDALETWAQPEDARDPSSLSKHGLMVWEEKFVMLWWLSHLMLAPFDLVSMSSESAGKSLGVSSLHVDLPLDAPPIAKRLVHVSTYYLCYASKEREAAGMLLARLALKPDMQSNGLQKIIVESILSSFDENEDEDISIYSLIGILSFLARFSLSAEPRALWPLLTPIYMAVQHVRSGEYDFHAAIASSPLARKLIIKVGRAIAVAGLKLNSTIVNSSPSLEDETLEDFIVYLFTALEDKDTSVRVAASKALSYVVVNLEADWASQMIANLIEELEIDEGLWEDPETGEKWCRSDFRKQGIQSAWELPISFKPDLSAVDAMHWHGLVFTLSQLVFRKSIPTTDISDVVERLVPALHFEQRSSLGASIGTSVRDAACFGLWSFARRYTTKEINESMSVRAGFETESRLQPLANNLVVAATLDPAGNIRRGASAALQEMIGRHPDTIVHGIKLVQVVDYHAIALRSRAMLEVAVAASEIDQTYWESILDGLLGWRGTGSPDPQSRRHAALAIGRLTIDSISRSHNATALTSVRDRLCRTPLHKLEERHGLILALAQVVPAMCGVLVKEKASSGQSKPMMGYAYHNRLKRNMGALWGALFLANPAKPKTDDNVISLISLNMINVKVSLLSDLTLESVCRLISALALSAAESFFAPGVGLVPHPSAGDLQMCVEALNLSLCRTNQAVMSASIEAAANLFRILDSAYQENLVFSWIRMLEADNPTSKKDLVGVAAALGAVFEHVGNEVDRTGIDTSKAVLPWLRAPEDSEPTHPTQVLIIDALLSQLESCPSVELRYSILKSLTFGVCKSQVSTINITMAIFESLCDYTIDEKGDVGSLVRSIAIDAVTMLLGKNLVQETMRNLLIGRVCTLAAEKLDKIRWRAWNCLKPYWSSIFCLDDSDMMTISDIAQASSVGYFRQLLLLDSSCEGPSWRKNLIQGYVISAGAGSESLVQQSRLAFYLQRSDTLCATVVEVFVDNQCNDRVLVPTMEFLAFLLETKLIQPHYNQDSQWHDFFNDIQKIHYKSSSMPKILSAVRIYACLVELAPMRKLVLKKLCQMLLHPFPMIRNATADAMLIITEDKELMGVNWARSVTGLKGVVEKLKERLGSLE